MSAQYYDTIDLVLDDTMTATCPATRASATMLWQCASPFHGDNQHYFTRVI